MSRPVERLAVPVIMTRAGRALHRIDQWGMRGVTDISAEEIEAMALALAILGVRPLAPGEAWSPPEPEPTPEGEQL